MLVSLYIKNFALIRELEIDFDKKFNIITGETGAGKSIIVDALMMLLGERASTEYIREGEKKSIIEGVFEIRKNHPAYKTIKENDFESYDELFIIRREITRSHSRNFLNDTPIQVALLKKLGDLLVDFHGQHDHQLLLNKDSHIRLLDSLADAEKELSDYSDKYCELLGELKRYKSLLEEDKYLQDKQESYKFELEQINKVNPKEKEDEEIERSLKINENAEFLTETSYGIFSELYGKETSAYNKLNQALQDLNSLRDIDEEFEPFVKDLESAIIAVEEISKFANDYRSGIEFNPEEIETLRERMFNLNRLIKKYGGLNEAIKRREELTNELDAIENRDEIIKESEKRIIELKKELGKIAESISENRQAASRKIKRSIEGTLKQLGIQYAQFETKIKREEIENTETLSELSVIINGKNFKAYRDGADRIEFFISPNKGEKPKPLSQIASGGEISRIMLALKHVLADSDELPMLVFDEIDAGISGGIAQKAGVIMKELAKRHQIISITHLAQICALADKNIHVKKYEMNGRTIIEASSLDENEKLEETARLISGEKITKAAIESAKDLMNIE